MLKFVRIRLAWYFCICSESYNGETGQFESHLCARNWQCGPMWTWSFPSVCHAFWLCRIPYLFTVWSICGLAFGDFNAHKIFSCVFATHLVLRQVKAELVKILSRQTFKVLDSVTLRCCFNKSHLARAWAFFFKISKIWLCNAISQEWINQNTKFFIPICRKFQALPRKFQNIFIILTVSGVTAVRSDHDVMSYIPDIGT